MLKFLLISSAFIFAQCANVAKRDPNGRMIFMGSYTKTIVENKTVTSLVPSSCIQVDATLPPCRTLRYLNYLTFPDLNAMKSNVTAKELAPVSSNPPTIHTTSLGWAEYFGIFAPTVTVTTTAIQTATVEDPNVVVTYAIKGCKPAKLPIDQIQLCPAESNGGVNVVPTPTYLPAGATINENHYAVDNSQNHVINAPLNHNLLEPSMQEIGNNNNGGNSQRYTEALPH